MPRTKKNEEWAIYNCHIHSFTRKNVPRYIARIQVGKFFGTILAWLEGFRFFMRFVVWLVTTIWPERADSMMRLERFVYTGKSVDQTTVFKKIQLQYPVGTKFIVLPMNMHHMELGNVEESIDEQHKNLLNLARKVNSIRKREYDDEIIYPFYTVHPEEPDIVKKVRENLGKNKFRGIKIYPNLGYYPHNEKLMEIYKICQDGGYPVITHCSPNGVWKYGMQEEDRRRLGNPENYVKVLTEFPKLRLCLAHFGSAEEWVKHLKSETPTEGPKRAWVRKITDMLNQVDKKTKKRIYPNLYTDISYTIFMPRIRGLYIDLVDYLKVLLSSPHIRESVLFGSDYYMAEQEEITEKESSILLRSRLGEDLFKQIAHHNPKKFLGVK